MNRARDLYFQMIDAAIDMGMNAMDELATKHRSNKFMIDAQAKLRQVRDPGEKQQLQHHITRAMGDYEQSTFMNGYYVGAHEGLKDAAYALALDFNLDSPK